MGWFSSNERQLPTLVEDRGTQFSKVPEATSKPKAPNSDMKQLSYRGPTNISRHGTNFSCHSNLAPNSAYLL
jgi:hypothetical protein